MSAKACQKVRTKCGLSGTNLRSLLKSECDMAGSQKAWAEKHGVSPQYVSDVLAGRKDPGEAILEAMNIERVISYRPKP